MFGEFSISNTDDSGKKLSYYVNRFRGTGKDRLETHNAGLQTKRRRESLEVQKYINSFRMCLKGTGTHLYLAFEMVQVVQSLMPDAEVGLANASMEMAVDQLMILPSRPFIHLHALTHQTVYLTTQSWIPRLARVNHSGEFKDGACP